MVNSTLEFIAISWQSLALHILSPYTLFRHCKGPPQLQILKDQKVIAIVESSSYCAAMPKPEVHHLFHQSVADHSFSADRQTLAVARDSSVELYLKAGDKFQLKDELAEHDKTVTGVDIAPNSGKIVTCSQGAHQNFALRQETHVK